jgi:hypothetical protein
MPAGMNRRLYTGNGISRSVCTFSEHFIKIMEAAYRTAVSVRIPFGVLNFVSVRCMRVAV